MEKICMNCKYWKKRETIKFGKKLNTGYCTYMPKQIFSCGAFAMTLDVFGCIKFDIKK